MKGLLNYSSTYIFNSINYYREFYCQWFAKFNGCLLWSNLTQCNQYELIFKAIFMLQEEREKSYAVPPHFINILYAITNCAKLLSNNKIAYLWQHVEILKSCFPLHFKILIKLLIQFVKINFLGCFQNRKRLNVDTYYTTIISVKNNNNK